MVYCGNDEADVSTVFEDCTELEYTAFKGSKGLAVVSSFDATE